MTTVDRLELELSEWLDAESAYHLPDHLGEVVAQTAVTRQRPWWSSLERWLPMDLTTRASTLAPPRLGRMILVGLLILALVTWFARIPFEPTPGVPQTGPMLIINMALVSTFVVAVEGLVFGLIPIRFLPGQKIFAWSRWRWALLWGAGLALFAHVLMYPVTLAQPSPDPATLATTLVSAGLYGAIAVGFWAAFRYRAARNEESGSEAAGPAG